MASRTISLIVSTYNRPGALTKVLLGVARQKVHPKEILLADDGSSKVTCAVVKKFHDRLSVPFKHIWHDDLGFRKTKILNKAIACAEGEYIVLLDGDCVPHEKFIADHDSLAESGYWVQGRRCFIREHYAPSYKPGHSGFLRWCVQGRASGFFKGVRWPVPLIFTDQGQRGIIGCNMGMWREDLIQVNGFDEEYEGWGLEDSDLGNRLYHLGVHRAFVYGRAVVYHLNHPEQKHRESMKNQARLDEVINARVIKCSKGLDSYL